MKGNRRQYCDSSLEKTLHDLKIYTNNAKCVDRFKDELIHYDKTIVNSYVLIFNKFLQNYFTLYKPLNTLQKNYFSHFFYKHNEKIFLKHIDDLYKITGNINLYTIALNIFKTFWKLQK